MIIKSKKEYGKTGASYALSGNTGKQTTGPHLHFQECKAVWAMITQKT